MIQAILYVQQYPYSLALCNAGCSETTARTHGITLHARTVPTPKKIVSSFMSYVEKETRRIRDKKTKIGIDRGYLQCSCLKPTCTSSFVSFQDSIGFKNPYMCLHSCYGKGLSPKKQEELLLHSFKDAREKCS